MARSKRLDLTSYIERTYRKKISFRDLSSFNAAFKETDLWVSADRPLEQETIDLVFDCRRRIEAHIERNPEFATSLTPVQTDPYAPSIIKEMIDATKAAGVGPMASVAGAIAGHVGIGLLKITDQVIVENGGDVFLKTNRPVTVSIFAGSSPFSDKLGLVIPVSQMPLGICSSSATVGHSLSLGVTDACCILSPSAALADGAATSLGNKVRSKKDLHKVAKWAGQIDGIIGGIVIVDDEIAAWGDIELVDL